MEPTAHPGWRSTFSYGGWILLLCVGLLSCRPQQTPPDADPTNPAEVSASGSMGASDALSGVNGASSPLTLEQGIELGAEYLARVCDSDGQFVYRVNLDPAVIVEPRYNVVRHAGALYAMGMYHERTGNEQVRRAMERAGKYLREKWIAPLPDRDDLLAVWSRPEIEHTGDPLEAKLGGTGLDVVNRFCAEGMCDEEQCSSKRSSPG